MVVSIKINDIETLNIHSIQSFTASEWSKPKEITESNGSATALQQMQRKTVLTIVRTDGKRVTLCGASADAALEILHGHGF